MNTDLTPGILILESMCLTPSLYSLLIVCAIIVKCFSLFFKTKSGVQKSLSKVILAHTAVI